MIEADLVKIRGALEQDTLVNACFAMERVLEELGYHRNKEEKTMLKEKSATLPHCYFCGTPCDEKDFCYGCHTHICARCWKERNEPETIKHNPDDHSKS